MFSNLSGWRVNLSLLQEAASKELLGLLDKCSGTKVTKREITKNFLLNP